MRLPPSDRLFSREVIKFYFDQAQLTELQNAPAF